MGAGMGQDFEGECYDKLGQKDYERFSNPK